MPSTTAGHFFKKANELLASEWRYLRIQQVIIVIEKNTLKAAFKTLIHWKRDSSSIDTPTEEEKKVLEEKMMMLDAAHRQRDNDHN